MRGLPVPALGLLVAIFAIAPRSAAHAETVYEFNVACRKEQVVACLDLIRDRITQVKARDQGRAFCAPRAWGLENYPFSDYPLSLLDYIRVRLSAARFGDAEMSTDDAISDILKAIYPCD